MISKEEAKSSKSKTFQQGPFSMQLQRLEKIGEKKRNPRPHLVIVLQGRKAA